MNTVVLVVNNREVTAIIPEKTDVVNRTQILTYTVWYENGDSLGDLAHTSGVGSDRNTRQSGLSESCQESWQHDYAELTGAAGIGERKRRDARSGWMWSPMDRAGDSRGDQSIPWMNDANIQS